MKTQTLKEIIEEHTSNDLLSVIEDLSSINATFLMYDHEIDLEAHRNQFHTLQCIVEILWKEVKKDIPEG